MQTTYRNEKSVNGYSLDVLKSALQKYIRRGETIKALYVAGELDMFADAGHSGERIRTNFIHRLMIIFLEDISLANYGLWKKVDGMFDLLLNRGLDRNRTLEIQMIQTIVVWLCKSQKIRLISHLNSISCFNTLMIGTPLEDFHSNLDSNHERGFCKAMMNKSPKAFIYAKTLCDASNGHVIVEYLNNDLIKKWWKEIKTKEQYCIVFVEIAHIIFGNLENENENENENDLITGSWCNNYTLEIDEYVMDRHTKHGNRSLEYFVNVGAHVENEYDIKIYDFKDVYVNYKLNKHKKNFSPEFIKWLNSSKSQNVCLESTRYEFLNRVQLICSQFGQDTYFALDGEQVVVVKGPFLSLKSIEKFRKVEAFKKKYDIACIHTECIWMIPDRWGKIPLGIRNHILPFREYPFLVSKSLLERDKIITRVHSSKKWPDTIVLDPKRVSIHLDFWKIKDSELMIQYLELLAVRIHFGLGDMADRNFLLCNSIMYGIDEDNDFRTVNLLSSLKKKKYQSVCEHFKKYKSRLHLDLQLILETQII